MPIILPPSPTPPGEPVSAAGYGTLADLYAVAGDVDVREYSNLDRADVEPDGTASLDVERTQRAMDDADAQVSQYLRMNGCTSPATSSDPFFSVVREAWALLAVRSLYRARGNTADTDDAGNMSYRSNVWAKDAREKLASYALNKRMASFGTSIAFRSQGDRAGYFPCG